MKKDNFVDFRYRLVESTIINHKTVEVTYRNSGKVIKRYIFVKEAPGINYIDYAQSVIAQELSNDQLSTSSKELAKPTSHKALKVILATTLSLGVATFAGLYTWRHFQNISEQNSIVAGGVSDIIMALSENSTESEIEKAREAYEALSAAEKKAVPAEALQYLEKQEALLKEDKDFAKNLHNELDTWVNPFDIQMSNALNDEKYPKLKAELLPAIDRYDAARERAKKYVDDSLEIEDKAKFSRYRRIADEAKGLFNSIDEAIKHEYEYYREDVIKLEEQYNNADEFLKKPAYDDELKYPLFEIESKIRGEIGEEQYVANLFAEDVYDSAIDKENDEYAKTTYERLQKFSDQYFTLITTRPRMKKFIDDACLKHKYVDFRQLIEAAYDLLEDDVKAVSTLFNRLSELEERAINPEKEIPSFEDIVALWKDADQIVNERGKRVESLLNQYRFDKYLVMLQEAIVAGQTDAEEIIESIVDYTTHVDQGPEKPGTVCTELEIDALAYRYGSVINSIAKKIIDKDETVIALGGFEKAIALARAYLAEDIQIVDSLCASLDTLINSDDIPTTLTDQRIITLHNAYNSYVNRGYRRIQKLAIERGFEEKFRTLEEAITRANAMYTFLKENNDPLTATATYEQLMSLDDSYHKATTLLKYIIDKIIEKDGVFVDWATAMEKAKKSCLADDENAKYLCEELIELINSDEIPTTSTDHRVTELKDRYNSMTLRAKAFADDYGFSTKLKELLDAIAEGNAVYTLAVEYASADATCESEDIIALQNRYIANKIVQKIVDKLLLVEKETTWTEIVNKMYVYLYTDLGEAERYSNEIAVINKNTDRSRRMAAADHVHEDISVKANERIIRHIVGYDDFEEYYVSHVQNKILKSQHKPEDIFNQIGKLTEPEFDPSAGMASTAENKIYPDPDGNVVIAKFKKEKIEFSQKYDAIDFGIKLDWLATTGVEAPTLSVVDYSLDPENPKVIKRYSFTNGQKNKYVSIDITAAEWSKILSDDADLGIIISFSDEVVNSSISVTTIYQLMTD